MKQIILEPWAEACGTLKGIIDEELYLTLDFDKFQVKLGSVESAAIKDQLNNNVGKRISCLRTDLPDKPVLMRTLDLNHVERDATGG
jgi:hypothetical protein